MPGTVLSCTGGVSGRGDVSFESSDVFTSLITPSRSLSSLALCAKGQPMPLEQMPASRTPGQSFVLRRSGFGRSSLLLCAKSHLAPLLQMPLSKRLHILVLKNMLWLWPRVPSACAAASSPPGPGASGSSPPSVARASTLTGSPLSPTKEIVSGSDLWSFSTGGTSSPSGRSSTGKGELAVAIAPAGRPRSDPSPGGSAGTAADENSSGSPTTGRSWFQLCAYLQSGTVHGRLRAHDGQGFVHERSGFGRSSSGLCAKLQASPLRHWPAV
mmetsp:Transcript_3647/g.10010  ORF Transcript_3647/g.10010 Transcript_3647/m.10010 type:complete len:270 (-) Transcript_3647:117-926(-)